MAPAEVLGIYPSDSVADVASSLPIDLVTSSAAKLLAADIENKLHLIVQEGRKFTVASKRREMRAEDLELAMERLGVDPVLIPPRPLPVPPFEATTIPNPSNSSQTQVVYHSPDDEIDFNSYLKEPLPRGIANSAGVTWKAHWLAVEGVQPSIPENPSQGKAGSSRTQPPPLNSNLRPSARATLPPELQLYYTRLTTALTPPDDPSNVEAEQHRQAGIASVREDTAVQGILVYIVKWLSEGVQKCLMAPTRIIGGLLDGVEALLANEGIFLEPFLHQLLPPVLSVLLTVPLGPWPSRGDEKPAPHDLRVRAGDILGKIIDIYGDNYPGMRPRLVNTFISVIDSPPFPSPLGGTTAPVGRYEGALIGISVLGPQTIKMALFTDHSRLLRRIDDLADRLYPGSAAPLASSAQRAGRKNRTGYQRAIGRLCGKMLGLRPGEGMGAGDEVVWDEFGEECGWGIARALERRGMVAKEMLRVKREYDLASADGANGDGLYGNETNGTNGVNGTNGANGTNGTNGTRRVYGSHRANGTERMEVDI